LDRIMDSLAEQQRELLYRLTLPVGAFVFEVVAALAKVDPEVGRPREQMNKLLGAWVQRDAERRFIVSPLVKGVSSEGAPGGHSKGLLPLPGGVHCRRHDEHLSGAAGDQPFLRG